MRTHTHPSKLSALPALFVGLLDAVAMVSLVLVVCAPVAPGMRGARLDDVALAPGEVVEEPGDPVSVGIMDIRRVLLGVKWVRVERALYLDWSRLERYIHCWEWRWWGLGRG